MTKPLVLVSSALSFVLLSGITAWGEGKIKGYMVGDYYFVAAADKGEKKLPQNRNAFQFRRIYFTYEKSISTDFSIRYRLEAKDAGFGKGVKMEPFVKHGYLKWKNALSGGTLYMGLSGTPTWALAEKVWGYRSIAKTVMDQNKIGSSADLGVAFKGKAGRVGYYLMLGNGPGQKPEEDHGKKFYGSLSFNASDRLVLEGYADFNMRPAEANELTIKAFAGLKGDGFNAGVEVFTRTNKKRGESGVDERINGLSAFASLPLGEALRSFARIDALANDLKDTSDFLFIAGLDRQTVKNVHLMPNIIAALQDDRDPHIQLRLTSYYKF